MASPTFRTIITRDHTVDFWLAVGLILVFPLNLRLSGSVRLIDVYVLFVVGVRVLEGDLSSHRKGYWVLVIAFLTSVWLGLVYGSLARPITIPAGRLFIVKFVMFFVLVWLMMTFRFTERENQLLIRFWIIVFVGMTAWVYLYHFLRLNGVFRGSFRPSFPMTNIGTQVELSQSDAHLLSAYLAAVGTAAYVALRRGLFRAPFLLLVAFAGLYAGSMVLTGSRNGIVTLPLAVAVYETRQFLKALVSKRDLRFRKRQVLVAAVVVVGVAAVILRVATAPPDSLVDDSQIGKVITRALTFDFVSDPSAQGRVFKQSLAIETALSGPLLTGIGIHTTQNIWWDGTIGTVLLNAGAIGILVWIGLTAWYHTDAKRAARDRTSRSYHIVLSYFLLNWTLAALVGEFFLTTRGAAYFAITIGLMRNAIAAAPNGDEGAGSRPQRVQQG